MEKVNFEPEWKRERMMDGESGNEGDDELVSDTSIINRLAKICREFIAETR